MSTHQLNQIDYRRAAITEAGYGSVRGSAIKLALWMIQTSPQPTDIMSIRNEILTHTQAQETFFDTEEALQFWNDVASAAWEEMNNLPTLQNSEVGHD